MLHFEPILSVVDVNNLTSNN